MDDSWVAPDGWSQDDIDQYEKYGITPDDLLQAPMTDDERLSLDISEAEYMNAWHDEIEDYDANTAF